MTLLELIAGFRILARDQVAPYLWEDTTLVTFFNQAQSQACIRGRLICDDTTEDVCKIALTAGTQVYTLNAAVFEIVSARLVPASGARSHRLDLVTREWLDAEVRHWRDDAGPARWLVQDDTSIRVVGDVQTDDAIWIDCYRLPIESMTLDDDDSAPEIHAMHHEHLIQWALHRAFSIPDADGFDPNRSALAERAFTAYFGPLPDSDARRSTHADTPHYNRSDLPA